MNKRNTLLIGADIDSNRIALRDMFHDYYHLLEASSIEQALVLLKQNSAIISCLLLDIDHEWTETCKFLESVCDSASRTEMPVIVLLPSDIDEEEAVLLDAHATDVIRKPCPARVIMRRVRSFIDLYQERAVLRKKLREQSRLLQHSNDQMIDALSNIIEQRSLESGQHIQRIRGYTHILLEEIARSWPEYGLDQKKIEMMASAAALHDIGKISIPDAILNKPGYLTKDEFEIMQAHTVNGSQILEQLKGVANEEYLRYAYNICRYHHERWDGRGYPDGLRKDEIPICAQVTGVADVYDALTNDRVYKAAYHSDRAATMILNGECGVFSPKVLESFKVCFPRFVELEQYYKGNKKYEYKTEATRISGTDTSMVGESAADRLQAKYQALLHYQNATVLEADLVTGIFHLIYNPNPDYRVPENAMSFHSFASQVAQEQIHPEDRQRYIEEIQHCHGALFELGQRRHSVYARMKGAATGLYRPYEFVTIRIESDDPKARDVLLLCRPLEEHIPESLSSVRDSHPEENLQMQAAFLSNLLFIRYDTNFSIVGDMAALCELGGYEEQEICGKCGGSLMHLIHPEDRENLLKKIREQLAVGIVVNADFRICAKSGKHVWVLGKFYLYTDQNGEEYFCVLLQNDSKRHTELEKLRNAAVYRDAFLSQTNDITFVWDIVSDECTFDEKWKQRLGYAPCKARFRDSLEGAYHLHPDDIPTISAFHEKLRDGASYAEADVRILDIRGGYLWNRFRAGVIRDENGKAIKAVGSILDIDSLKRESTAADRRFQQMMVDAWNGKLPDLEVNETFFAYTFRHFQEAADMDAELKRVMRVVGEAAKLGRIFLYEVNAAKQEYHKTVEWCADEAAPGGGEQELSPSAVDFAVWEKMFDKNGVLCISDISCLDEAERNVAKAFGVQAVLLYKIENNGQLYGVIGLEDRTAPRVWTSEQIKGFHTFVQILSLFLTKDRALLRIRQCEETMETILNNQDIWAYVIDEDYCLQFINERARAYVPAGRAKQRCYEVFMRRNAPCPNCPAVNIREKVTASAEMETVYLNLRMRSTATAIKWEGRDAVLLRCTCLGNAELPETAPKPNPFKTVLHPDVLRHTGSIDRSDPEIMMAALQTLMDHLPGIIFVKDLELVYRAGNQAFAEMTGRSMAQDIVGKTDSEIFVERKLVQRYTSDDRKLLSGGRNLIDYVEPSTDENGEARYNTTSKYILTGKSGRPVGLLGISRDITKEMRSRYRYEKEVDYLFALPRDVFAARLIDIDDWRIIGQRAKSINGNELPAYESVESMLEDVKRGLQDETAKDSLYFYEEFSPIQLRNLHNSGQSQIEMEHIFHFKNGASAWVRNEIKFLTNPSDGHRCVMSVLRDIDSMRKTADEMAKAATMDALTGVLSRGAGVKRMEEYLATEGKDGTHAMFMIDVDNFKSVNDLFGHPVGDKLLLDLANAIRGCFRDSDLIIRMGGDEFLAFIKNIPTYYDVQKKAEKLLQAVRKVRPANTEALISTSIGISLYPEDGVTQETLFVKADQALYRAKKSGKNQAAFASDENVLFDGGSIAMSYEDYNSFAADHTNIYCYISDIETHELLHLNHMAMTAHGIASPEGFQGRKCYEVLHGRSTPCPHCTNDTLQEGKPHCWTRKNEVLGITFRVTAIKVHINGRWCRLANAQACDSLSEA